MAELADALDLGSSGETRTGSIPARRTNLNKCLNNVIEAFLFLEYGSWLRYLFKRAMVMW